MPEQVIQGENIIASRHHQEEEKQSQTWDYVEPTALGSTSGSYGAGLETVFHAMGTLSCASDLPGQTSAADPYAVETGEHSGRHDWAQYVLIGKYPAQSIGVHSVAGRNHE